MAFVSPVSVRGKPTGTFRVCFRWEGKTYNKTASTEHDAQDHVRWIDKRIELVRAGHAEGPPEGANIGEWFMSQGKQGLPVVRQANGPIPISDLRDAYLASRLEAVEDGRLSGGALANDRYLTGLFVDFCKKNNAAMVADAISPDNLNAYKKWLKKRATSSRTLWHGTYMVKALITWGWRQEKIESVPRMLDDFRKVQLDPPSPVIFTRDEITTLLNGASDRLKLYILLALNGGYTQKDIATLEPKMVLWQEHMVDRVRHKTMKRTTGGGTPQKMRLWSSTERLLKQFADKRDELLLRTEDDRPVVWEEIRDGGRVLRVDSVRLSFHRLTERCGIKGKSFKDFRKTGATAIRNEYKPDGVRANTNAELMKLYLAHAEERMARHYNAGDWQELFAATDWLGSHLGIA